MEVSQLVTLVAGRGGATWRHGVASVVVLRRDTILLTYFLTYLLTYLLADLRGGNSPKISPSCGRAWLGVGLGLGLGLGLGFGSR